MTLPLIYALDNTSRDEKRRIINLVKVHNENPEKVAEVIDFVRKSGGLDYAKNAMYDYKKQAFELLHSFPPSDVRTSLEDLVNYVTEREK
jgi:octaprenyl-diphosphate synthase